MAVQRTRAVLLATVALAALAISPAAQAITPFAFCAFAQTRFGAWNNGAATASVTASITPNQTTTYVSRLGVVQAF